jgi:4-diphosphocytidyl-2-C-methyl-D-erythritol kinase
MRLRSFAKINLGLEIVGRRPDGYHDIRTLFQSIDLADRVEIEPTSDGRIRIEGDDPTIPWDEANLVHRAARLLRACSGTTAGAFVRVRKAIPAGKGLGGGSSNAALVLYGLNRLWSAGLGPEELAGLALRLGSDVPYFLRGGLCLGESRGEALTPLPDFSPLPCVLAFPPYPILTAEIYAGVDPSLTSEGKDSKIMRFLKTGDFGSLENALEDVILRRHPELEDLKRFFRGRGATLALVTGSGSAVFGLFSGEDQAREALDELRGKSEARLAETLRREDYWVRVGAGV